MKIKYKLIISVTSLAAITPIMLSFSACKPFNQEVEYIAHRGLSSAFFQNTAASFVAAGQNNFFNAIETDIYLTKDQHIVCVHDPNPFRKEGSHERDEEDLVTEMSLDDAISRNLWTGYYDPNGNVVTDEANEYGISGEFHMPTFRQYLSICKTYNKIPVIEIKDENGENLQILISKMAAQLNEFKLVNKAQIIAFDDFNWSRNDVIKNELDVVLPNVNFQKLIWLDQGGHTDLETEAYQYINNGWNIDMDSGYLNADIVKAAHKKHLKVNTWTVNDEATRDKVLAMGVDQITGNFVLSK